jgi:phosphate transport system protein
MRHFDEEVANVKQSLLAMGGFAEKSLSQAIQAVADRNEKLAIQVEHEDDIVDQYEKDIDDMAVNLLAKAPLATDLRLVVVAMKISQNLERVGDEATTIARRAVELSAEPPLKGGMAISPMAALALGMLRDSLDAFVGNQPEKARPVIPRDKEVDALNRQLYQELIGVMEEDPSTISRCLNLITVAKCLERAADHAKNIAQEVVYICEAFDIRHEANRLMS